MWNRAARETPAPKGPRPKTAPLTVGGYSILGLAQDPVESTPATDNNSRSLEARQFDSPNAHTQQPAGSSKIASQPADLQQNDLLNRNLDYLFEGDEKKHPPRWRMVVALALLAIAAGTLVWQWQRNGYPWDDLTPLTSERINGTNEAKVGHPATTDAKAPQDPSAETSSKPADTPGATPESTFSKPKPTAHSVPAEASLSKAQQALISPERHDGSSALDLSVSLESKSPKNNRDSAIDNAISQQAARKTGSHAENAEAQAAALGATAQASSPEEAVQLLAEGTKYLLGNGVAQDCDLANKYLRAASRFSSDAESMLGTMYASGHCVDRDLPTAYRWYVRALRNKPGNTRVQNDLTVLWNQMTTSEKQAASHGGP